MSNWIKLSRHIANNDMWHLEPFTKAQAWIDILMLTNYKDGHLQLKNGQLVKIQRGQCGWSKLKLAKRWQWSRNKVTRFFDYLFEQKMIQQTSLENLTILTVLNYDRYQNDTTNETTNDTTNETTNETLIKKVKKEKKDKENISSDFENFFSLYPRKEVKKEAAKCFEKALKDGVLLSNILDGVKRYNRFIEEKKVERRFIKLPTTWLNQGCWDDDYGMGKEEPSKNAPMFLDENITPESIQTSGDLFYLTSYANLSAFKYRENRVKAEQIFEESGSIEKVDKYCRNVLGWQNEQARENCC